MQADTEAHRSEQSSEDNQNGTKTRTRLPVSQLICTSLLQFAEPMTAMCIYPFINQFIRATGITGHDERKTGYYGGLIESVFFFSEALTVVPWGYASDRFGRRSTLLLGPLGLTFSMLVFGTSTTFWPLVGARCMQGIFNGNIGVAKTIIAESTDATNRADAFALMPLAWSIGSMAGQLIGGTLSNPAQRWPDTLGRIQFLERHPYFLPCATAGGITCIAFIVSSILLKETLPSAVAKRVHKKRLERSPSGNTTVTERTPLLNAEVSPGSIPNKILSSVAGGVPEIKIPKFSDVLSRPIILSVAANGFLAFCDMLQTALLPLFWSTSTQNGGLGLDPFHIGATMASFGILNSTIQALVMGPVLRRFGVYRVFRVSICSLLLCFSVYPVMTFLVKRTGYVDGYILICIFLHFFCYVMNYFAYGAMQVIIVESVPPGGPMGTANSLAQMAASVSRTVAPTFASSLYAFSLQHNILGGNLTYIVCFSIALLGIAGTSFLPDDTKKRED